MDGTRFDDLIKRLGTTRLTRLSVLRGLAGGGVAITGMRLVAEEAEAADKKGSQKKRKACDCQSADPTTCTTKRLSRRRRKKLLRNNLCAYAGSCKAGVSGCQRVGCLTMPIAPAACAASTTSASLRALRAWAVARPPTSEAPARKARSVTASASVSRPSAAWIYATNSAAATRSAVRRKPSAPACAGAPCKAVKPRNQARPLAREATGARKGAPVVGRDADAAIVSMRRMSGAWMAWTMRTARTSHRC